MLLRTSSNALRSISDSLTRATNALSVIRVDVFFSKLVPSKTGHLQSELSGSANATHQVYSICYWLKMAWMNARSYATKVINDQTLRDSTYAELISPPVAEKHFESNTEASVACCVLATSPQPAWAEIGPIGGYRAVEVNLHPEAFGGATHRLTVYQRLAHA